MQLEPAGEMGFAAEYPHSCCSTVEQAGRPEAEALAVMRVLTATVVTELMVHAQELTAVVHVPVHEEMVEPEGTFKPDSVMPATSSPEATAVTVSAELLAGMLPVMRMAASVE